MERQELLKTLFEIIDGEASATVGMLCKRVEILEDQKQSNSTLFKALSKEIIYEQSRVLKKILQATLTPSLFFYTKKD
jgi:hypothetical protein